jgi:hypothetical protein
MITRSNHSIQRMGASRSGQLQLPRQWRLAPTADADRWATMLVVGFIALLLLAGCRSTEPHLKPASSLEDVRSFPIGFSLEEIVTRTWTQAAGETIGLLGQQVFKLSVPEPLEVLAATFGVASSDRAVCIDFYAAQANTQGGKTYFLLCHDQDCPAYNTKISYEAQNETSFFNVKGQDQDAGSSKRYWRQYYYVLIPQCVLVRAMSEFVGQPSQ